MRLYINLFIVVCLLAFTVSCAQSVKISYNKNTGEFSYEREGDQTLEGAEVKVNLDGSVEFKLGKQESTALSEAIKRIPVPPILP